MPWRMRGSTICFYAEPLIVNMLPRLNPLGFTVCKHTKHLPLIVASWHRTFTCCVMVVAPGLNLNLKE